jgi:tetratricopeptide (TPR) repeat protein
MALRRLQPSPLVLAALVAFAAAFVLFALVDGDGANGGPTRPAAGDAGTSLAAAARSTDARIAELQRAVRAAPQHAAASAALGIAYLQKVRESGDAAYYARAEAVLGDALRRSPAELDALVGMGELALARHDFRAALRWGERARAAHPGPLAPYPILVDANVELGRYAAAERELQQLVDRKPALAAYARVAYLRELHGDLGGAVAAMRRAVSAGGGAPENLAYVQTLLGNLEFERGRLGAARAAYGTALAGVRGYAPATAGLAQVDAARGRLGRAIARLRGVVARIPLPQYVIALGETELAAAQARAGRRELAAARVAAHRVRAGRRDLALVGAEQRLLRANGVDTDVELALFEANHRSPARAVVLARRGWQRAPSVRSADALGWALTRAGRPAEGYAWGRRALRLGSRDATFLYHAGISARAAGRRSEARALLRRAIASNARFSPLYGPRARRALEQLR